MTRVSDELIALVCGCDLLDEDERVLYLEIRDARAELAALRKVAEAAEAYLSSRYPNATVGEATSQQTVQSEARSLVALIAAVDEWRGRKP
jgi:hypothetical protein